MDYSTHCSPEIRTVKPSTDPVSEYTKRLMKRDSVCQIPSCDRLLPNEKAYYKRYKICPEHAKATQIILDGVAVRFCQQCGRFHPLDSFDGVKRTCKAKLKVHNARRRHNKKAKDNSNSNGTTDDSLSSASLNTECTDHNMNNSYGLGYSVPFSFFPATTTTTTGTGTGTTVFPLQQQQHQAMPVNQYNHNQALIPPHTSCGTDYLFTNATVIDADNSLFTRGGGDLISPMHQPPSSHTQNNHNDADDDLIWEGADIFAAANGSGGIGDGGSLLVHPVPTYLTSRWVNGSGNSGDDVVDDDIAGFVDAVLNNNNNNNNIDDDEKSRNRLSLPGLLPPKQELLLPGVEENGSYVFDNKSHDNYNSNEGGRMFMAGSDDGITGKNIINDNTVMIEQQEGLTLERVSMKLFKAHPDDLPSDIQKELRQLLEATTGASTAFGLSIRPGCVQITMDALLTDREKDVVKARGVGELAQVALNHALSAVPALSSPSTPAAAASSAVVLLSQRDDDDDEDDDIKVAMDTPFDKDRKHHVPLINGKHPDLMFSFNNEIAYVNRDDGIISTFTTTATRTGTRTGTGTSLPPPSSAHSSPATDIIPHVPLIEAVQPLAMTPEAAAITNLVLYGKYITGSHDAVFIRSRGRNVNLSVMAVVPPNNNNNNNNNNSSDSQQALYVSDRERVVVELLEPAQGLHRVEVQRGALLSQPVSFLVLDDAEAVREIQQLEMCSTVTPSQVQAFVSDFGVVVDFIARAGVLRHVTVEDERRAGVLARRLLVLSVNRGWKAMVRMLMPLALLPVGIPIQPNVTVTAAIDGVMAELDGCARALGAIPLCRSSFSSSVSYFEETLRKAMSTSFLHVVAGSSCIEIVELLDTWARRMQYQWTIKTGEDQLLCLTPLHLTCLLNDQAAMAAALTTMIDAATGGNEDGEEEDENNSHGEYKLWFQLKDGKGRTAAQFAKVVGNDGVLQWLNKERDCRGLSIGDIEKEIAEEEMMVKNKKKRNSGEGSKQQMGVETVAADGGSSFKQMSSLNEGGEEDMLVAAGASQKKPAAPPRSFTFWKNKCSKERTTDIKNDVRTVQIIEDARAAAHSGGAAARRRREHNNNVVPVAQQVAVLSIIALATMALKILSSS